ncbi:MAG: hypothetical protein AAF599_13060 [Bacteroidota bacterium]
MPIELTFDQSNTPIFSVEAVSNELIYIAISNEQLTTDELEVQNQDAIIWHWHSGINNNKFIGVEDGSFLDSIALKQKNVSCQLSLYDQLYWAAWAWDEEGIKITHSTESQLLDTDIQQEINFTINKVSTTDSDGDTFLKAGELITYKVTLDYKGTFPLNDLVATLSSSSIVELPITIQVDSTITDKVDLNYTFTLPDNAVFKEEIPLKLELAFNDCFTQALDLNVATTGRNVCLLSMTLKKIYTNPPGNYWDDICGFVPYPEAFRNPDPCYTLTSESIPNIYSNCPSETSGELEDVDPRCPDAQWLALSPCAPLALNEFHTVRVLDENAPWCEDNEFIGQIGFYPRDFLDSTLTFQIVTSETIQIGLELAWE